MGTFVAALLRRSCSACAPTSPARRDCTATTLDLGRAVAAPGRSRACVGDGHHGRFCRGVQARSAAGARAGDAERATVWTAGFAATRSRDLLFSNGGLPAGRQVCCWSRVPASSRAGSSGSKSEGRYDGLITGRKLRGLPGQAFLASAGPCSSVRGSRRGSSRVFLSIG